MDLEKLRNTARDVDDTTRRSNEVKAKARENRERYAAMECEVKHFIKAVNGCGPDEMHGDNGTGYIVVEKEVRLPELGSGYIGARIEGLGTGNLVDTSNFLFRFELKPNLDYPRSPGKKIEHEYFACNNSGLAPEVPFLHKPAKATHEDGDSVEENTTKLDTMINNTAETLQLLIAAAMNPDLNPQIAEQVQRYYETLGQTETTPQVTTA